MNVAYLESRIKSRMDALDSIRRRIRRHERGVQLLDRIDDREEYRKLMKAIHDMYKIVDDHNRMLHYLREMLREVIELNIPAIYVREEDNAN